ncbi:MAG TPA: PhoH family protein, partial [Herbaspirillum sp.]
MKTSTAPQFFIPEPLDNKRLAHLCGPLDENLRQISAALDVTIFRRGEKFIASGSNAARATEILEHFYALADKPVSVEEIQLALVEQRAGVDPDGSYPAMGTPRQGAGEDVEMTSIEFPVLKTRRHDLRGRTPHQSQYIRSILEHDITFGIGPAGTGKTYLAMACAVAALEARQVKRIVLTRPAVEAGEKLGFLPGDLAEKVNPYLRPLYDALDDMMDIDKAQGMIQRGRTLNESFVILDEAQNTTSEQMRMFLTRLGSDAKAVVTGDVTQVDLPEGRQSGLAEARDLLDGV